MNGLIRPLHPFRSVLALSAMFSLANVAFAHLGAAGAIAPNDWAVFVVSAAELTGVCALMQRCLRKRAELAGNSATG